MPDSPLAALVKHIGKNLQPARHIDTAGWLLVAALSHSLPGLAGAPGVVHPIASVVFTLFSALALLVALCDDYAEHLQKSGLNMSNVTVDKLVEIVGEHEQREEQVVIEWPAYVDSTPNFSVGIHSRHVPNDQGLMYSMFYSPSLEKACAEAMAAVIRERTQ